MNNFIVYGGEYRGACPKEIKDQEAFIRHVRTLYPKSYGRVITHIKNEGKRTFGQIYYDKKQGLVKGCCDIIIAGKVTFCCELKRKDRTKSKVSVDQKEYLNAAHELGSFACIAYGYDAAVEALNEWIKKH